MQHCSPGRAWQRGRRLQSLPGSVGLRLRPSHGIAAAWNFNFRPDSKRLWQPAAAVRSGHLRSDCISQRAVHFALPYPLRAVKMREVLALALKHLHRKSGGLRDWNCWDSGAAPRTSNTQGHTRGYCRLKRLRLGQLSASASRASHRRHHGNPSCRPKSPWYISGGAQRFSATVL